MPDLGEYVGRAFNGSRLALKLFLTLALTTVVADNAIAQSKGFSPEFLKEKKKDARLARSLGFSKWTNPETNELYLRLPMRDEDDYIYNIKGPIKDLNVKSKPHGYWVSWKSKNGVGGVHVDTTENRVYGGHINKSLRKLTKIRGNYTSSRKKNKRLEIKPEPIKTVIPPMPFELDHLARDIGFRLYLDENQNAYVISTPGSYDQLGGDNIIVSPHIMSANGNVLQEGTFRPSRIRVMDNGYYLRLNSTNGKTVEFSMWVDDNKGKPQVRIKNNGHGNDFCFNGNLDFSKHSKLPYSIEYDYKTKSVQVKRLNEVVFQERVNLPDGVSATNCRDQIIFSDPYHKSDFKKLYGTDPRLTFSVSRIGGHIYFFCPIPSGGDYIPKPIRLMFR